MVFTKDVFKKHWDSRLKTHYAVAQNNLGAVLYLLKGRLRKRFLITRWLLSSSLATPQHITTLEIACYLLKGRLSEAISHYKMAIKLKPDFTDSTLQPWDYALSVLKGMIEEAIDLHLKMAIELTAWLRRRHITTLGLTLSAEGKIEEAISHLQDGN